MAEKDNKKSSEDNSGMLNRLMASRTVILSGGIDSEMAQKTIQQLILLDHEDSSKEIIILLNCPGGEVYSGLAIYDAIHFISAPVTSIVVGLAASMGSIIPLAAPKGNRYSLPHSKFMLHQPSLTGYQGRATDLEIQAKEILRERERLIEIYSQQTGRKTEEISSDIDRDNWMTPEEALAYGLIDKIIETRKELPKK